MGRVGGGGFLIQSGVDKSLINCICMWSFLGSFWFDSTNRLDIQAYNLWAVSVYRELKLDDEI
jgi:hypothetical protein